MNEIKLEVSEFLDGGEDGDFYGSDAALIICEAERALSEKALKELMKVVKDSNDTSAARIVLCAAPDRITSEDELALVEILKSRQMKERHDPSVHVPYNAGATARRIRREHRSRSGSQLSSEARKRLGELARQNKD